MALLLSVWRGDYTARHEATPHRAPDRVCSCPQRLGPAPSGARETRRRDALGALRDAGSRLVRSRRGDGRSEEHTSELQSQSNLVCRLLLEKKKKKHHINKITNKRTDKT